MPWSRIILHHSAGHDSPGLDMDAIERWHVEGRGWDDIGYHRLIEQVGPRFVALEGRPLTMQGAHTLGMNDVAIGVCLLGNLEERHPPQEQIACAADHVASLCLLGGIPVERIDRHDDHDATDCPGRHFDLELFRHQVSHRLSSSRMRGPKLPQAEDLADALDHLGKATAIISPYAATPEGP